MEALLILLAFPLAWPFIAKRIWHTSINWTEMTIQIVGVTIITVVTWQLGIYGKTLDTEIWNGYVTKKEVNDGWYQTSYCCATDKDGNCTRTCYTDHYTRSYDGYSTAGDWTFDSIDTTSRSRRNSFPPPRSYTNCVIGEPASREQTYTNFVQAVPESLFHDESKLAEQYVGQVPSYPRVHSFYKINRVLSVGSKIPGDQINSMNNAFNIALKTLGAQKQVNIIVILTEIDDPTYRYAVENAWLGGEKNDVVLFVGLDDNKITWVDVMTWALNKGNELFHVKLRDSVKGMETFDPDKVVAATTSMVMNHYDRPQMKDFEYLEEAIDPPTWVILLAVFFAVGGSLILTFVFHKYEIEDFIGDLFTGRRSKYRRRW